MVRRAQPPPSPPDLSPERAYSALSTQLDSLQGLKKLRYSDGEAKEKEWAQLTGNLIIRAFGSENPNKGHFSLARSAGEYYIRPFGGEEYEFYRAVKTLLGLASKEIFIVDPYISPELFDIYADAIPRTVSFRLLTANVPSAVLSLAQKYAAGGNFQFRSSNTIHDRVLLADSRVWLCGQSLKDAAKKKPTYIVEHDEPLMRAIYEEIWGKAASAL
jgi:hypothetical protein